MAEANGGGAGGGSNRNAANARPRVQQLRPTNKDAPVAATTTLAPIATSAAAAAPTRPSASRTESSETTTAPALQAKVVPRIVTGQGAGSTIMVNNCQRGNPILQHIKNIGWEYGDIVPDYQVGVAGGALFLSLRYHRLHPEYIHTRIKKLGHMFSLRILLVMCDVEQHDSAIKELTKVALVNSLTLMVAWTAEEAGNYIERYKAFEHKAPDLIRERINDDYMSHLNSALTNIKGVNKTDVITLATNLGSFKRIVEASSEELSQCPGFGATKVRRIRDVFKQPFRVGETRSGRERRAERQRLYNKDDGQSRQQSSQPSSTAKKGRFVDDDKEEVRLLGEMEARTNKQTTLTVTDPSTYVTPRKNDGIDKAKATADPNVEEEAENADDWDFMDGMTEEEKLLYALELSKTVGLDEEGKDL